MGMGIDQWEWEGMGIDQWEWEGMGILCSRTPCVVLTSNLLFTMYLGELNSLSHGSVLTGTWYQEHSFPQMSNWETTVCSSFTTAVDLYD